MKVYVTKYALTEGILSMEAIVCDKGYANGFFSPREWVATEDEALAVAANMRGKKITSLEKQIKKIKAMNIKVHAMVQAAKEAP